MTVYQQKGERKRRTCTRQPDGKLINKRQFSCWFCCCCCCCSLPVDSSSSFSLFLSSCACSLFLKTFLLARNFAATTVIYCTHKYELKSRERWAAAVVGLLVQFRETTVERNVLPQIKCDFIGEIDSSGGNRWRWSHQSTTKAVAAAGGGNGETCTSSQ